MSATASPARRGAALVCRGLVKRYGDVTAVAGIDLEVRPGECFGLLGPNGAGKTTTVEIFEGLLAPSAGDVEVLGRRWGVDDREIRARIGVSLQETRLTDKLTAIELVRLFRSFFRDARGRSADEMLDAVGLRDKAESQARHLSGGQRQRLTLACALVGNPEVLFLDEPTTGLDPQSRRSIWEIVKAFRDRGGTVLLTTHYMEEAERLCDRLAVIDHGRVIALDTPRGLVASLGGENVVEFHATPAPDAESLRGLAGVRNATVEGDFVRLTTGPLDRALPAIVRELSSEDVAFSDLRTHAATLEDVFVSLTGRNLRDE